MHLTPSERRLKSVLQVFFFAFLFAALMYQVGPIFGPLKEFSKHLPFVSNSAVKVGLLSLLCLYAAGDIRGRRNVVGVVIAAHVVSLVAMGVYLLFLDTGAKVVMGSFETSVGTILKGAMALDGILTAVLLGSFLNAKTDSTRYAPPPNPEHSRILTGAERRLRRALVAFGILFTAAAVGYEAGPFFESSGGFFSNLFSKLPFVTTPEKLFVQLPFVSNSAVKVVTLALLCFVVAKNLRRNMSLVGVIVSAHVISLLTMGLLLVAADTSPMVKIGSYVLSIKQILLGAAALDGGIVLILFLLNRAAYKARYKLKFFTPMQFRSLIAVADVTVYGKDETISPEKIAANVDDIVSKIAAKRRWVHRMALMVLQLHPLLYFKAPLSELSSATRLIHLKKHFQRDVLLPDLPDWWRRLVQAMIRVVKQISYVGYYNDPATFASVGYVPFSQRERFKELEQTGRLKPPGGEHELEVKRLDEINDVEEAEICIIGSGAAGATLAYQLADKGHDVLVVERGKHVEPKDFTEDEGDMIGKLYADGIFQQTTDFRFTILQGSCVGGSTVVNNAVCFDLPDPVLEEWNTKYEAGIDSAELGKSTQIIRDFLHIAPQGDHLGTMGFKGRKTKPGEDILNPSWKNFAFGVENLGLNLEEEGNGDGGNGRRKRGLGEEGIVRVPGRTSRGLGEKLYLKSMHKMAADVVDANIVDCLGCGYCNIGCKYGRKMSMLDKTLPAAQKLKTGNVRIFAECEVERIRTLSGKPERVTDIRARLANGRKITIRAEKFVLSAGAVASSYLLLRSRIGRNLPVGYHASFNIGSPMTAEFDQTLNAYDGLQISHYGLPKLGDALHLERGFVMETWWNPPVAQAISMPGWFEEHFNNMKKFDKMMGIGVLVGSDNNGRIKQALTGGADVDYKPTKPDMMKLADGLIQAGEILFAAGARRLLLNTWGNDVFTHPNQLSRLHEIASDPKYMTLGTGHPQGGNAISNDPRKGVVGTDFKVHGYSNLFVCDASVFPSAVKVNPQLTIMALAHYAAQSISES